jgi:hypothetical protein
MSMKLVWGLLGGLVIGAAFGAVAGNTPIGIAICMAAGAVAAYFWERSEERKKLGR